MNTTLVVYRVNANGQVIALFPQITTNMGQCKTFMDGEFGSASYGMVYCNTRCATPSEYTNAQAALESLGYVLRIQRRKSV